MVFLVLRNSDRDTYQDEADKEKLHIFVSIVFWVDFIFS